MKNSTKDLLLQIVIGLTIIFIFLTINFGYKLYIEKQKTSDLCNLINQQTNLINNIIDLEYNCRSILFKSNPTLTNTPLTKVSPINCEVFK